MVCKACEKRIKDWKGDDPKCSFLANKFSHEGWNCALANGIRELAESDNNYVKRTYTDHYQHYATIDLANVKGIHEDAISLYVGWYKNRGRTECMWLMFDYDPPRTITEEEATIIVNHFKI